MMWRVAVSEWGPLSSAPRVCSAGSWPWAAASPDRHWLRHDLCPHEAGEGKVTRSVPATQALGGREGCGKRCLRLLGQGHEERDGAVPGFPGAAIKDMIKD